MMNKLRITIIFIFLSTMPTILFGQTPGRWVQCSGEAAIHNITNEEAQVLAKRQARRDAIEKACGITLQSETLVRDFMSAGDFIQSISYGRVVEEKDVQWRTESVPSKEPGNPPLLVLHVDMSARVAVDTGKPDPSFKVNLKMNRTVFQSGDEVILKVKATQDCYLSVLNLGADDTVRVLFPNKWQRESFVPAQKEIEIPDKPSRQSGLHIRVANLPGHRSDNEMVKVIATKQQMDILSEADFGSGFGLMGTPKMAVDKLMRWLTEIPVSDRAEATVIYMVQSGQ
jgi:hypothetical protein